MTATIEGTTYDFDQSEKDFVVIHLYDVFFGGGEGTACGLPIPRAHKCQPLPWRAVGMPNHCPECGKPICPDCMAAAAD